MKLKSSEPSSPISARALKPVFKEIEASLPAAAYEWQGRPYRSLSAIARAITGTRWNGWVFFGLQDQRSGMSRGPAGKPIRKLRCAIYTRKSTEEGLDKEFNSLDAQREACEAYIASQKPEGWALIRDRYDDGGFSGGTMDRPRCSGCCRHRGRAGRRHRRLQDRPAVAAR